MHTPLYDQELIDCFVPLEGVTVDRELCTTIQGHCQSNGIHILLNKHLDIIGNLETLEKSNGNNGWQNLAGRNGNVLYRPFSSIITN